MLNPDRVNLCGEGRPGGSDYRPEAKPSAMLGGLLRPLPYRFKIPLIRQCPLSIADIRR
jgi:hypothetical protein